MFVVLVVVRMNAVVAPDAVVAALTVKIEENLCYYCIQCDQITKLCFLYLAIFSKENVPDSKQIVPK